MQPTVYQKPEIRDANDNIIQQGAFGKNTALANATNDGWIDYVANDLEFLYDLAKDEVVPVPSLPASGQLNKTYLLTTTGVSYRWSGTQWVAVSSSEAVGRAESAALLAEQWATKTDGTVDGTEYSAKYYAEQAQQSADDAQDVADDMADHLVQIDKNTGGVAKNSKRISNIEKLLQGNLYDYDTDDDTAYTKTVPSGALPYAGIETLGGKTVVMNQLIQNGDFSDGVTGWTGYYTTTYSEYSVTDNVLTVTIKSLGTVPYLWGAVQTSNIRAKTIAGHKYLFACDINAPYQGAWAVRNGNSGSHNLIGTITTVNSWTHMAGIAQFSDNAVYIICVYNGTSDYQQYQVGDSYKLRNVFMIDLTLMFGSGSEPSTVEEFEAMFPADYYPYNAGTLLSAGVTEVESVGKNLCDAQTAFAGVSSADIVINGDEWDIIKPSAVNNIHVYDNTDGYTGQITVSYQKKDSGSSGSGYKLAFWYTDGSNEQIASPTYNSNFATYTKTSAVGKVVKAVFGTYNQNKETFVKNVMIEKGTTATAYSPYMKATMPIPAEVQALAGYGLAVGSVSNYIDFERKVFVQNVGRVDLGTLSWILQSADYPFFYTTVSNAKTTPDWSTVANAICPNYTTTIGSNVAGRTNVDKVLAIAPTMRHVRIRDSAYTDAPSLKTALNGVYLYYELATPIETDISQYLTDNLIEVGAGGTLTFPNANGDDYHIPVPSDVTYMIDLQEAIENGN